MVFADINLPGAQKAAEASKAYATDPAYQPFAIHLDVTSQPSIDSMVNTVTERFARIDNLVNAAGIDTASYAKTPDLDPEDYDRVLATNTKSLLLVSQAVIKIMLAQEPLTFTPPLPTHQSPAPTPRNLSRGSIVNITSGLASVAIPGKGNYTISKHASAGLTKQMAADLAPQGVRVNSVQPSWVRTPMFEAENVKAPGTEEVAKKLLPMGRVAEVDEVGAVVVFLLSPAASYVTGTGMLVDAGISLGMVRAM